MWEVLDMQFPDAGAITSFLEGTNTRLLIRGFDSTSDAWDRVKVLRDKIRAPVEIAAYIDEQDVSVRIVKTGGAHRSERIDLPKYMAELERLDNLLVNESITVEIDNNNLSNDAAETSTNTTGKKRPRDEEPHVIEMDYTEVCM
ncbi:uncharacterized protein IUM83_00362 [Phytophthora cinnamomi]|uniref:uncharacterized protein n=1 Tax=Phytophthora cinnamomi TaxID=4785 RepID=UPI003559EAC2|nr:hypothetical protein IUM83_00362 [Phytophthora cinnamomi]